MMKTIAGDDSDATCLLDFIKDKLIISRRRIASVGVGSTIARLIES